jgi:hypothetical protein
MSAPVLANVAVPIGRLTKIGHGGVPLGSATLGLLQSNGGAAVSSWTVTQTSGPSEWATSSSNTPAPSAALTAGSTAVFSVVATNADGSSSAVNLTYNVQDTTTNGAYNWSQQSEVTAIQPLTGDLTLMADKQLWLAVGATAYENAQMVIRRFQPTAAHRCIVRPADLSRPPLCRDIKLWGCKGVRLQGMKCRWDTTISPLIWVTPDGSSYGCEGIDTFYNDIGAATRVNTSDYLPNGIKYESVDGGTIQGNILSWITGAVIISATGSTFKTCKDITICENFVTWFRNNGVVIGGSANDHVCDNIVIKDNLFALATQRDPGLHMDTVQLSGSNTGTMSNIIERRNIGAVLSGTGVLQGHFDRNNNPTNPPTYSNFTSEGNIYIVGSSHGIQVSPRVGVAVNYNLVLYDPNNFDAGGNARSWDFGEGTITQTPSTTRIYSADGPSDPDWGSPIAVTNNIEYRTADSTFPSGTSGNYQLVGTTLPTRGYLDSMTDKFADPAALWKADGDWAALTPAQIKAEIIRCLTPVSSGALASIGPLTTGGAWRITT